MHFEKRLGDASFEFARTTFNFCRHGIAAHGQGRRLPYVLLKFADKVVDGDRDAALNKLAKIEERIVRQMERKPTAKGESWSIATCSSTGFKSCRFVGFPMAGTSS
jgi:hypothetical protein